jgi:hypothetical protein
MKVKTAFITPEYAQKLLARNEKNRNHNERRSRNFAAAMGRGEWEINGDTIKIAKDGRLLDGQHRLWAIVYSGIPQQYIVVSELDESAFDTIDRGATRTVGDIFQMRGEKHYSALASTVRLCVLFDKTGNPFSGSSEDAPTARECERFIDDNPDIKGVVDRIANGAWIRKFMSPSVGGFSMFCFNNVDEEACEVFFDELCSGVISYDGSPVLALRDRLMEDKSAKERMTKRYMTAITFKAFRLFRAGEKIRFLRVRETGKAAEKNLFDLARL